MHPNGTFRACNGIAGKYCFTGAKEKNRHLKKLAQRRSKREFIKRQSGKLLILSVSIECFYGFTIVWVSIKVKVIKAYCCCCCFF